MLEAARAVEARAAATIEDFIVNECRRLVELSLGLKE